MAKASNLAAAAAVVCKVGYKFEPPGDLCKIPGLKLHLN